MLRMCACFPFAVFLLLCPSAPFPTISHVGSVGQELRRFFFLLRYSIPPPLLPLNNARISGKHGQKENNGGRMQAERERKNGPPGIYITAARMGSCVPFVPCPLSCLWPLWLLADWVKVKDEFVRVVRACPSGLSQTRALRWKQQNQTLSLALALSLAATPCAAVLLGVDDQELLVMGERASERKIANNRE